MARPKSVKNASPMELDRDSRRKSIMHDMQELWGEEKQLIAVNLTNGIVSIGFGKKGDEGGMTIPRSSLPVNLTEQHSFEVFRESSDFRRAIAKGLIKLISLEEADRLWSADASRREYIAKMARTAPRKATGDATIHIPMDDDLTPPRPMVIDEDTATAVDAAGDPMFQKMMEYENSHPEVPEPIDPGTDVNGGTISARIHALIAHTKNGSLSPMDAMIQLDQDAPILTYADLQHVVQSAPYSELKKMAQELLNTRLAG